VSDTAYSSRPMKPNFRSALKMKITFVLHTIQISGGHKAIYEFSNHLHNLGHNVSIVYPLIATGSGTKWYNFGNLSGRIIKTFKRLLQSNHIDWFDLKASLIRTPTLAEKHIPDADIVVATWWETAYWVKRYSMNKGKKFYLVQHYEIWGGPKERVDQSYRLGLRNIVHSTWLKKILCNKLNAEIDALIPHAPDLDHFYPETIRKNDHTIRLLMPYRRIKWKGVDDGIRAYEIVKQKYPDVQLVMFGPDSAKDLPYPVEFHKRPSNPELRRIYNSCDIFIFPSHKEGFGMPPMEAMVCKCAVVTTDVGAVSDYTIPGKTALVSPPHSPEGLAKNIIMLVENHQLRKRIAEAGYKHIVENFSWHKATKSLEQSFKNALVDTCSD